MAEKVLIVCQHEWGGWVFPSAFSPDCYKLCRFCGDMLIGCVGVSTGKITRPYRNAQHRVVEIGNTKVYLDQDEVVLRLGEEELTFSSLEEMISYCKSLPPPPFFVLCDPETGKPI